jgi:Tfp pilus assembly protein PilX
MSSFPRRQRGATLIVSLIMLVLITLLAVSSFTLGKGNVQIVGNMQQRTQIVSAAEQAIGTTISNTQFTQTPTNFIPAPCNPLVNNTICVGVNGDNANDISVLVTPTCDSILPITNLQALNDPTLFNCSIGAQQNTGQVGATNGNSLCAHSVWEVLASATDTLTGANAVIDEGVGVLVPATTVCP